MNKKVMQKIRKELMERRKRIINDLDQITKKNSGEKGEHRAIFPDLGDKPDENVMEIGEYTTNLATEKVLESTLRDIDNALKRMENGTYGICKYCKKEIEEKRLLARPVASACVECKSKLQQNS